MNEFSLINENNVRFSLKDFTQKAFIPSVRGLGYKNEITFVKVGNVFKTDNKELTQGVITGSIIFSSHSLYQSFVNYVENSTILRLVYKPLDVEYYRNIEFGGITDVTQKASTTEAEIEFFCNGLYYTSDHVNFTVEEIEGQSQYDLVFDYIFNDYATAEVIYTNPGHSESEMIVEMFSYLNNPVISLYVNSILKYEVKFNIEVQNGEKLIYSVIDGNNYLKKVGTDGTETNVISSIDITKDNFFKIPKGTSSIRISADSSIFTKIVFTIFTSYKGV